MKLILLFISFGFVAMATPTTNLMKSNLSEDILIIKALLGEQSGDFIQSRKIYDELYRLTGKKEYLIQEAKDALVQKSDPSHSIDNLMKWITAHPTDRDAELYRMLVALYIQQGSLGDAEDVADEYLSFDASIEDQMAVSALKLELGKPKEAVEILQNAYKKYEDESILLQMVSIMDKKINKHDQATYLLETYINKHEDTSVGAYFKLIEMYVKDKKLDKVSALYKKLYKRDPQKYFLQKIIEISLYQKDIDGVIAFLEQSKDNKEILYTFYKEKNLFDKAEITARLLYKKTKDPKWIAEEGMLVYEKARKSNKIVPEALNQMQVLLEDAVKKGIKDPLYLNYYGYTLIDHDLNIDRGIELVKIALKKEPTNTYYLDSLAWGLYKKGKCQEAYEIMKTVVAKEGLSEEEIKTHWGLIQQCGVNTKF